MKKISLIVVAIILIIIIGIYIGTDKKNEQFKIVKLSGGNAYANFTKSDFSWTAGPDKDSVSALPLIDGDLLYIFAENEELPLYRYRESDGDYLKFRWDDFRLLLNDRIIALDISENGLLYSWLDNINAEEVNDLRYIAISGNFTEAGLPYLKKLAGIKPETGIFFRDESPVAGEILEIFKPAWLAAPDCDFDNKIRNRIAGLRSLKLLYIDAGNWDLSTISKLKNIETLVLTNLHQPDTNNYIINKKLRSLSIMESDITNISFLDNLKDIVGLNLSNCDMITGINPVQKFTNLKCLSLINCENLADIEILNSLTSLRWLSFNPGITEEEAGILAGHLKKIQVVELISCKNIKNAAVLEQMKDLSCLSVYNTDIDISSLYGLKGLRYLSLPDSIYADPIQLAQVQDKIPNCVIVPSHGLCLGSAWLLLMIPALIICRIAAILIRKSGN